MNHPNTTASKIYTDINDLTSFPSIKNKNISLGKSSFKHSKSIEYYPVHEGLKFPSTLSNYSNILSKSNISKSRSSKQ